MDDYFTLNPEETKERFTWVRLNPNNESKKKIREFIDSNREVIKYPRENFHSTLFYSVETPIFKRKSILQKIESNLPIRIPKTKNSFDVFGESDLVLRYDSPKVMKLNEGIMNEALRQVINEYPGRLSEEEVKILEIYTKQRRGIVYSKFNSHMAIATNFYRKDLEKLTDFNGTIIFDSFSWTV